jgi:hypothetical protein
MLSKKWMISALAAAALASPAAATARPADDVPPPPSLMAESAADEYQELRSRDTAGEYQDLRSPDTRDAAAGYDPPTDVITDEVAPEGAPSSGFDVVSGGIGAAAGIGLAVAAVLLAGGLGGHLPRRHAART